MNGGTFTGNLGFQHKAQMTFSGTATWDGTVTLTGDTGIDYLSITGGTFYNDPTAYVATGYRATDNSNGTWTVTELPSGSASFAFSEYEALDSGAGANKAFSVGNVDFIFGIAKAVSCGSPFKDETKELKMTVTEVATLAESSFGFTVSGTEHYYLITFENLQDSGDFSVPKLYVKNATTYEAGGINFPLTVAYGTGTTISGFEGTYYMLGLC